jgi:hypothetical protein
VRLLCCAAHQGRPCASGQTGPARAPTAACAAGKTAINHHHQLLAKLLLSELLHGYTSLLPAIQATALRNQDVCAACAKVPAHNTKAPLHCRAFEAALMHFTTLLVQSLRQACVFTCRRSDTHALMSCRYTCSMSLGLPCTATQQIQHSVQCCTQQG